MNGWQSKFGFLFGFLSIFCTLLLPNEEKVERTINREKKLKWKIKQWEKSKTSISKSEIHFPLFEIWHNFNDTLTHQ